MIRAELREGELRLEVDGAEGTASLATVLADERHPWHRVVKHAERDLRVKLKLVAQAVEAQRESDAAPGARVRVPGDVIFDDPPWPGARPNPDYGGARRYLHVDRVPVGLRLSPPTEDQCFMGFEEIYVEHPVDQPGAPHWKNVTLREPCDRCPGADVAYSPEGMAARWCVRCDRCRTLAVEQLRLYTSYVKTLVGRGRAEHPDGKTLWFE